MGTADNTETIPFNWSSNPEHDQEQQQQQKETNQLTVAHNYTILLSDRRPLTSSSLFGVESSNHDGHAAPTRTPPHQQQNPQNPHNDSMVISVVNASSSDIGSEEYIKILCEFYYHYSAQLEKPAITDDQTEMNEEGPVESHPFELPSESRQDLSLSSSSSSSSSSDGGGTIDLTSSDTATYTVLVEPISRDGHRDRWQSRGIRKRRDVRQQREDGDETKNTTSTSEVESKGVSGELKELDSVTERLLLLQTNMNIIPRTTAAAAAPSTLQSDNGDNAETSSTSVEVTEGEDGEDNAVKDDDVDGVDPKQTAEKGQLNSTYWSKTPDIFLAYLERRKNVNRGESQKGIEGIFERLLEPFADYENIASAAVPDGATTDFELLFGVSERHMRWFCSKLGGNNTRVHNFNDRGGGNNSDEGLTEAARVSTGKNSGEWSGGVAAAA